MTTKSETFARGQVTTGKNAIIEAIHGKMGKCPYYGTTEILDTVLIQKPSWGGKDIPENTTKLSAAANVEYMLFAKLSGVESNKSFSYYEELICTPKSGHLCVHFSGYRSQCTEWKYHTAWL